MASTDSRYELLELDSLRNEPLLSLGEVCRLPALRDAVGPKAVYRWVNPGIFGVRLPVLRVGRVLRTSETAVTQFLQQVTNPGARKRRTTAQAHRDLQAAEARADAEGL